MANILGHFDRVKQKNSNRGRNEWESACPACDSRERKLVITEESDRFLLYCRKSCSHDEIVSAAGLTWRDLKKDNYVSKPKPQFDTYHQALILVAEADMAKGRALSAGDRELYRDAVMRRAGAAA
jgi:hypothetical protein